ncbi:hypothetical protein VW41_08555 [Klebsiella michiganensis]|nr:hypothetical protein VW41_08555 [Klebsiella michiganensis]
MVNIPEPAGKFLLLEPCRDDHIINPGIFPLIGINAIKQPLFTYFFYAHSAAKDIKMQHTSPEVPIYFLMIIASEDVEQVSIRWAFFLL